MKISDGEKLIILMLSEIYDKLDLKDGIDQNFIRSAIFSDNLWSIPWKFSGIPFESEKTPEIVKEVLDILEMWSFIENGYSKLTTVEKLDLETKAEPFGKDPKFNGFDGNEEPSYLGIASFLINDLDRFVEFKERYLNSHMPVLPGYKRMILKFKNIRKAIGINPLTLNQMIDILSERIHPDRRNVK